jgi:hypothetical protein
MSNNAIQAYQNADNFALAQRMATSLAASTVLPPQYQNNVANCLVALDVAARVGCSPFLVMQNLDIIHGRPTWNSKFIIATLNSCGRFRDLRFDFFGDEGKDSFGCQCTAVDVATGEIVKGERITIEMAKKEGWYTRSGSKWPTMPRQMLQYRAASFFSRIYAPDILFGMHSAEEMRDISSEPNRIKTEFAEAIVVETKPAPENKTSTDELF